MEALLAPPINTIWYNVYENSEIGKGEAKTWLIRKITRAFSRAFPILSGIAVVVTLALALSLFITRSLLLVEIIAGITLIAFLLQLEFLILKYSGLYAILGIKNPADINAVNISAVIALIGILNIGVLGLYGGMHGIQLVSDLRNFTQIFQNNCP
ncbi:hypothetical protein ES703_36372 [subsurface metagenome]